MTKDATDHLRAVLDALATPHRAYLAEMLWDARAYLATLDATPAYDTLTNLNVQPGDVVEYKNGAVYTITRAHKGKYYWSLGRLIEAPHWRIVSRAAPAWSIFTNDKPTRDLSRDQLAAMKAWKGLFEWCGGNQKEWISCFIDGPMWGKCIVYRAAPTPTQEQPAMHFTGQHSVVTSDPSLAVTEDVLPWEYIPRDFTFAHRDADGRIWATLNRPSKYESYTKGVWPKSAAAICLTDIYKGIVVGTCPPENSLQSRPKRGA